eukprot:TRINITY_DN9656_c0_g1_i1.p2 TRINITY_DN9656_c0_g1~~TRINITY_DN9656_c0_g1_i1.p2  ORF type:complete len:223 (-),score=39.95 TRINITY_DN9656_c0_g1_i1:652-1320(-)
MKVHFASSAEPQPGERDPPEDADVGPQLDSDSEEFISLDGDDGLASGLLQPPSMLRFRRLTVQFPATDDIARCPPSTACERLRPLPRSLLDVLSLDELSSKRNSKVPLSSSAFDQQGPVGRRRSVAVMAGARLEPLDKNAGALSPRSECRKPLAPLPFPWERRKQSGLTVTIPPRLETPNSPLVLLCSVDPPKSPFDEGFPGNEPEPAIERPVADELHIPLS